jgi:hypothetical protein
MMSGMAGKGSAPYGWRWEGRTLVPVEHEQHVRWFVLLLHRHGYTLTGIAGELATLDLHTRDGAATWPKTTLHRIVTTAPAVALESTG